ncbi:MAG: acetyl/propionyl/methylcrotonyl-CoA carboxylase subunit alpha [Pseudomonadota bacterium]
MLKRVLIANRGEIACRIIRTCRRMGIETVAIYSDADAKALHVAMADHAVRLGPPPVSESYLRGELIVEAAQAMAADAVHPGYGFLSENPDFAEAVTAAGLVFVGPSGDAIRAMGLKDRAKALMAEAGVPVVPGYLGDDQDAGVMAQKAEEIGYPILIKARAGGGGKGMRRVDDPASFPDALASARREAESSFGDGRCLIEKWIVRPRHIEMQVFGDADGNVIHLFERDCSLQRRHQKVIEEAPAPGMTSEMRQAMGEAAVKAAEAVGYQGAATVEFIVDASDGPRPDRFWFMEMNTRLQVEHPVTEMITGLDLVEWQLRVAAGESLPLRQEDVPLNGWAFEARVYAEDAGKGFLPATGRMDYLALPEDIARVDSGVRQGDVISPFYDPMIAKVIARGDTRTEALNTMRTALSQSFVAGTVTNVGFLAALCADEGFAAGQVDTGLIERDLDRFVERPAPPPAAYGLAVMAVLGWFESRDRVDPWGTLTGWRQWSRERQAVEFGQDGVAEAVPVTCDSDSKLRFEHAGIPHAVEVRQVDGVQAVIVFGGKEVSARVVQHGLSITVFLDGATHVFTCPDPLDGGEQTMAGDDRVLAPMPGLIKLVPVAPGACVRRGEPLVVMEAMKMEHTLRAPFDGTVAEVLVGEGEQVAADRLLLVMETPDP